MVTDKSVAEQMRELAEDFWAEDCDLSELNDLADKVEALERELKATHIYLADEKRRREDAERENQKLKAQVSTMQQSMLKAIENRHEK